MSNIEFERDFSVGLYIYIYNVCVCVDYVDACVHRMQ